MKLEPKFEFECLLHDKWLRHPCSWHMTKFNGFLVYVGVEAIKENYGKLVMNLLTFLC
jgi:hypothetical protein